MLDNHENPAYLEYQVAKGTGRRYHRAIRDRWLGNMTADDFLKKVQVKSRVSVMEPYKDDLLKLRKAGLSYNQLLDFLRENKVIVAYATFSLWMRRHMPADVLPPSKSQPTKSPEIVKPPMNPAPPEPSLFALSPESPDTQQSSPSFLRKLARPGGGKQTED